MIKLLLTLSCLLLLGSCATTSGFYFGVDSKTPPSQTSQIQVGYGITIESINGKKAKFGPGPLILNVAPGPLTIQVSGVYHFRSGVLSYQGVEGSLSNAPKDILIDAAMLAYAAVADADVPLGSHVVEFQARPQETWFVGAEFSRSILEIPSKLDVLDSGTDGALDATKPQARIVARQVNYQEPIPVKAHATTRRFVGPMVPFFSSDSSVVVQSEGGSYRVIELGKPSTGKLYKISNNDLVWGGVRPDGSWLFLDRVGTLSLVDPQTGKVLHTQTIPGNNTKVIWAVPTQKSLFVQTSVGEIQRIDGTTLEAASRWKGDKILDWTVAETSEQLAVLTADYLGFFDSTGTEVAHRTWDKKSVKPFPWVSIRGLLLSPEGDGLLFHDQHFQLWFLKTSDLSGFPKDQWAYLGHSNSSMAVDKFHAWTDGTKGLSIFTQGLGADFSVLDYVVPQPGDSLPVSGGGFGQVGQLSGGAEGIPPVEIVGGVVSGDKKKMVVLFAGYNRLFFATTLVDTSYVSPKAQ